MTGMMDVEALKRLDDAGFAKLVCGALARHGLKTPGFNLAADAGTVLPPQGKIFFYPAEAHGLVSSGLKALREYDRHFKVSPGTREEFILADVEDLSRQGQVDAGALEHVASRLTGIGSLALIAPRVKA
jgi:hypothetical protein